MINFRNELVDRRVILYLNDCDCGGSYYRENATYSVKDQLKKVNLKDAVVVCWLQLPCLRSLYPLSNKVVHSLYKFEMATL